MTRFLSIIFIIFLILASALIFNEKIFGTDSGYELTHFEATQESIKAWQFSSFSEDKTMIILSIDQQKVSSLNNPSALNFLLPEDAINIVFSREGKFFAVVRLDNSSNTVDDKIINIDVYSIDGNKLYTLPIKQYYDYPLPTVVISDDGGSAVMGQSYTGEIWFYDQNGSLLNNFKLFNDTQNTYEKNLIVGMNKDGSKIAIAAMKRAAFPAGSGAANESGEPYLFLFSAAGEEIWKRSLPNYSTNAMVISDKGEFIAANSYTVTMQGEISKRTIVFDSEGNELGEIDLLFKQAHFSADSKYLIASENNRAKIFNVANGNTEWSYKLSKDLGMISSVRISNNGETAVLLVAKSEFQENKFIFTNPVLKILNKEREIIQELPIKDQVFEEPAIYLSPNSEQIYIGFKNGYQIYQEVK